eukprot:1525903-Amphidinium_carterae.1
MKCCSLTQVAARTAHTDFAVAEVLFCRIDSVGTQWGMPLEYLRGSKQDLRSSESQGHIQVRSKKVLTSNQSVKWGHPKDTPYFTNATLFNLTELPPRLVVLGGGATSDSSNCPQRLSDC